MIRIKQGLDLPLAGAPQQMIHPARPIRSVALLGVDYHGLKPGIKVQVGDKVQRGQVLFTDKNHPAIQFTAPAGGVVSAINRGAQRVFQSLVIDVDTDSDAVQFGNWNEKELLQLDADLIRKQLLASGLWTALRTRPFSKIPAPDSKPHSIFVTAIDTHPLAADPAVVISEKAAAFRNGLVVLGKLTNGHLYVCKSEQASMPVESVLAQTIPGVVKTSVISFAGPHPAGLAGTHIHHLDSVGSGKKTVWSIGYQDVIAMGELFTTGFLPCERVIALAGPQVEKPRLLRTQLGASLDELCAGELLPGDNRVISGSVLGGRRSYGPYAYLGRYHQQISVLKEGREREFMGWLSPGVNKHSVLGIYLSKLLPKKLLPMTTTTNGSERAMVPVGSYEQVLPLDMLATPLLRYLIVGDTDNAQKLGCLELDEEDLALCTYVCPGKYEYGPILRENLTLIEKEG